MCAAEFSTELLPSLKRIGIENVFCLCLKKDKTEKEEKDGGEEGKKKNWTELGQGGSG